MSIVNKDQLLHAGSVCRVYKLFHYLRKHLYKVKFLS